MQNSNLARSLQFLRLDTHLTSVKCDCNRFDVVTVVIVRKERRQRARQLQTMKKLRKLVSLFKWSSYEKYFRPVSFTCSHVLFTCFCGY